MIENLTKGHVFYKHSKFQMVFKIALLVQELLLCKVRDLGGFSLVVLCMLSKQPQVRLTIAYLCLAPLMTNPPPANSTPYA